MCYSLCKISIVRKFSVNNITLYQIPQQDLSGLTKPTSNTKKEEPVSAQVSNQQSNENSKKKKRVRKKKKTNKTQEKNSNKKPQKRKNNSRDANEGKRLKTEEEEIDPEQLIKDMCHWSQFNLPIEVLKGLKEQGFEKPMPIQKQVSWKY